MCVVCEVLVHEQNEKWQKLQERSRYVWINDVYFHKPGNVNLFMFLTILLFIYYLMLSISKRFWTLISWWSHDLQPCGSYTNYVTYCISIPSCCLSPRQGSSENETPYTTILTYRSLHYCTLDNPQPDASTSFSVHIFFNNMC